jgi:lipopolysaccharide transport system ATP-binding protein
MSTAIKVEDLSKLYRLGSIGTGTLSHDLNRWFAKMRGKEDPYLKLGQANDRSKKGSSDFVWALKDISFDVKQGDVLGIIGKNGAGKSTLLKILSRTTGPTKGSFRAKGRIASLLEVGTGFHPELSGRENVFLNGAILGMTKAEIRAKFDEIVAFSGVERYIDTPVKRYSSGMYVRLAFAVAAHLEPEILVVDEVLAVGDAEFQEKCLGKMKDVSGQGRTVLFVSHNMPAVKSLCKTGLYLKFGEVLAHGPIEDVLTDYLAENRMVAETGEIPADFHRSVGTGEAFFRKVYITNESDHKAKDLAFREPFRLHAELELIREFNDCTISFTISTSAGDSLMFVRDGAFGIQNTRKIEKGITAIEVDINAKLMPGNYTVSAGFYNAKSGFAIDWVENVYSFKVGRVGYKGGDDYPYNILHGYIEPESKWTYK